MKLTPMLEQYFEIKRQVPDAILLYRLGDFYEMFFEDAQTAAPLLDLVLTARGRGGESEAPMCGVPFHAVEQYIAKLVRAGHRVALCEQLEEPGKGKGIVRREVVRVITPGTAIDSGLVDRESCYLLSLAPASGALGAAWLDVSTGDFAVTRYSGEDDRRLRDDLVRFSAREAIFPRGKLNGLNKELVSAGMAVSPADEILFDESRAARRLTEHFGTHSLRGFGLDEDDVALPAAAGALQYAAANHRRELDHVVAIRNVASAATLHLDAAAVQNLEIFDSRDGGRSRSTLWALMNRTKTAMGGRTLRQWIAAPLATAEGIVARHDALAELLHDVPRLERIVATLTQIGDLDRMISRITMRTAGPRECTALSDSLRTTHELRAVSSSLSGPLLSETCSAVSPVADVIQLVDSTLAEAPPLSIRDGGAIRSGIDPELDRLRSIARDSKAILLEIETAERARTGISSLKVRYNSVFGYYIEVSKANLGRIPDDYIRKQTLVNAERFITPRLKELEEAIVGAEEKSLAIEQRIFEETLARIAGHAAEILATSRAIGDLDALCSLAQLALRQRYVRPALSGRAEICIEEGRHPIVESISTERYVPNDTALVRDENGILLVTGPNMGGKSTYLRQVALIVLLNQTGSFVPAKQATLGVFDRIFTRVGASDNVARGESTFMVEMQETANILHNATGRSLVVLDEVGRGTATFDGLSLAWAILEYMHDHEETSPITLFATHYHELTDLAKTKRRITNASVAVREWKDEIIFLRKVVAGAADKSYGIQVAKLAGIPHAIIGRAREILDALERKERAVVEETRTGREDAPAQFSLFGPAEGDVAREIRKLDVDTMSPLEALNKLHELKQRLMES